MALSLPTLSSSQPLVKAAQKRRRSSVILGCVLLTWLLVLSLIRVPHQPGVAIFHVATMFVAAIGSQWRVTRCIGALTAAACLCLIFPLGLKLLLANGVEMSATTGALILAAASVLAILPCRWATAKATPSPANKIAWFIAVMWVTWTVMTFLNDEAAVGGHRAAGQHPVVYRMWRDLKTFPVPGAKWKDLGFRVVDFDHKAAYEVVAAEGYGDLWKQLPNYAAKADLFRYAIVNARGGWYADADVLPLPGLAAVANNFDTVLFHEACGFALVNWLKYRLGLSTVTHAPQWRASLFAAPKGWRPLASALKMLPHRLRQHSSGKAWEKVEQIDITGPGLLADAIIENEPLPDAMRVPCNAQKALFDHAGLHTWFRGKSHGVLVPFGIDIGFRRNADEGVTGMNDARGVTQ